VPPATLDDLQEFAHRTAGGRHDEFSARALARAVAEYAPRRRERVAAFRTRVDGRDFPSVYAALGDPSTTFDTAELTLLDPPLAGRAWEWMTPFERIVFEADGAALVSSPEDPEHPRRAMARLMLREHFVPRSQEEEGAAGISASTGGLPTRLDSVADGVRFVRKYGVVPFSVALLLYFAEERVRVELDLLDDTLVRDPRAGRLPVARRVHRSSRLSHAVDETIATGALPVANSRALEVLFETHGLTPLEIAPVLGGVREYGASYLQGLTARGFASLDKRTGVYRPRLDLFLSATERTAPKESSVGPMPNPALRTSVMELLAAADSRATCPLCGDALPPGGPRTILCAKCQAEVGEATENGGPA